MKETAHLSLLLESDGLLIYQLVEAVKEVYDNHDDLCNNVDFDHLPCNVKKIKGHADDNANWFLQDCNKDLKN